MNLKVLLFLLMFAGLSAQAQNVTSPEALNMHSIMSRVEYPEEAKMAKVEGKVIVEIMIDEKGKVKSHKILKSPSPVLTAEVEEHVDQLKFKPAMIEGEGVVSKVILPFAFALDADDMEESTVTESVKEALKNPSKVTELDLSGQNKSVLEAGLAACSNTKILNLDDMRLESVPSFIKKMNKLKELSLSGNQLTKLPGWLSKLDALESIDLRDNAFSDAAIDALRRKYDHLELLTD